MHHNQLPTDAMGIEPKAGDEGRSVIYRTKHGPIERGDVTSWNSACVFVRFDGDRHGKGCRRRDLEWEQAQRND